MAYRYFFIQVMTPLGLAANYVRTTQHPLHPEEEVQIQRKLARLATRRVALITHQVGNELKPEQFIIINTLELEEAVAKARWPEDFGLPGPAQITGIGIDAEDEDEDEPEEVPTESLILKP